MPSVAGIKVDLAQLAARLRAVADALKRVPADQGLFAEERAALCNEVKAVAAELRGDRRPR